MIAIGCKELLAILKRHPFGPLSEELFALIDQEIDAVLAARDLDALVEQHAYLRALSGLTSQPDAEA